jgi:RimJ/RimL family protein N-acetyltransferase
MNLLPTILEGRVVRLEPLAERHCEGLRAAIADGELWQIPVTRVPHPDDVPQFIEQARAALQSGTELAFATCERATGRIAGSTRFMKVDLSNKRVEIGFTFLGRTWQRTAVNTEAKLLMLTHGFEQLDLNRIEFLTDVLNEKSRRAIERLGAQHERVLRSHMIMRGGRIRDSALYSITATEWPAIKRHLTEKLTAHPATPHAGQRSG